MRPVGGDSQGQVRLKLKRKERSIADLRIVIALASIAVAGCAGSPKKALSTVHQEPKPVADPPQTIKITNGSSTSVGTKGERLWTIRWRTGDVVVSPSDPKAGTNGDMHVVDGEIYNQDGVACRFKADNGAANDTTKVLTLTDRVRVDSENPKATLFCDRLVYDGNKKRFRALGHVSALGTMRTVGTIDEVWATPDLKKIATPDMFDLR